MKKRKSNTFINIIKENYLFLLLLTALTVIISIQGCAPDLGKLSLGNCCKIKDSADNQVKACVAGSLTQLECDALASSQGNLYSFALGSSCINFERNPDCGVDANNNKIGCYLDDGSGVKKFYPQANPPESPQPAALGCGYATTRLYKCDQGREVLVEDCATRKPTEYCVNGACTRPCNTYCLSGQSVSNQNTLCCGPGNIVTMHFEELHTYYGDFTGTTIDANKWNINDNAGMFSITQNDKLIMSKGATAVGFNRGEVNTLNKLTLIGDFSVQVDFNLVNFPSGDASSGNQFQLEISDGTTTWLFSRQKGWGYDGYATWRTDTSTTWSSTINRPDSSGKLKLVRSGNKLTSFYYNTAKGDWDTLSWIYDMSTSPVHVKVVLQNNNRGDALNVEADNLIASADGVTDSSKNNNYGITMNGATTISGKFENALNFDGYDDYVRVSPSDSLNFASAFTVEFWTKLNALPSGTHGLFVSRLGGGIEGWQIGYTGEGNIFVLFRSPSGDQFHLINNPLNINQWYHIVAVYSIDEEGAKTKIYLNGELLGTNTHIGIMQVPWGTPMYIATNKDGAPSGFPGTREFNGTIDELNIYDRALTDSEILNHHNNQYKCVDYIDYNTYPIKCSVVGTQCVGSNSYATCGQYDGDSCLEFGTRTYCDDLTVCVEGTCVPDSTIIKDYEFSIYKDPHKDEFTGNVIDSNKWNVVNVPGNGIITQNNVLHLETTSGDWKDVGVNSYNKIKLKRDFDVQVDFSNFYSSNTIIDGGIFLRVATLDSKNGVYIRRNKRNKYESDRFIGGVYGGEYTSVSTSDMAGKLRIQRDSLGYLKVYYWKNNEWVLLDIFGSRPEWDNEDMFVTLTANQVSADTLKVDFDNFLPLPKIRIPYAGTTWDAGDKIYVGSRSERDAYIISGFDDYYDQGYRDIYIQESARMIYPVGTIVGPSNSGGLVDCQPVCYSNGDCNDNDPITADRCDIGGTCSSACSRTILNESQQNNYATIVKPVLVGDSNIIIGQGEASTWSIGEVIYLSYGETYSITSISSESPDKVGIDPAAKKPHPTGDLACEKECEVNLPCVRECVINTRKCLEESLMGRCVEYDCEGGGKGTYLELVDCTSSLSQNAKCVDGQCKIVCKDDKRCQKEGFTGCDVKSYNPGYKEGDCTYTNKYGWCERDKNGCLKYTVKNCPAGQQCHLGGCRPKNTKGCTLNTIGCSGTLCIYGFPFYSAEQSPKYCSEVKYSYLYGSPPKKYTEVRTCSVFKCIDCNADRSYEWVFAASVSDDTLNEPRTGIRCAETNSVLPYCQSYG